MRARVLSFNAAEPDDLERRLNAWLDEAGDIAIEDSALTLAPVALPVSTLVVFYRERAAQEKSAKPKAVCTQCRKNPPANGLKTCQACQDYQRDYRSKRKQESKVRYP